MKTLLVENITALRQALELLSRMTDTHYRQRLPACFNSSVGGHVRHALDHYLSFTNGLASDKIDYEARVRDPRLETDRAYAIQMLRSVCDELASLRPEECPVRVRIENTDPHTPDAWATSSARRELQFLLSHTIHHWALIAVSCRILGVEPQPHFGIAPSTLRYREAAKTKVA